MGLVLLLLPGVVTGTVVGGDGDGDGGDDDMVLLLVMILPALF